MEVATDLAVWSHPGRPVVPRRWLLVRDPAGIFEPQAFLCTDQEAGLEDILSWFVRRWTNRLTDLACYSARNVQSRAGTNLVLSVRE